MGVARYANPSMPLPLLRTRDFARTTLRPRHRAVVRALGEAMFTGDEPLAEADLDALVESADGFMSPASKTLRFGLTGMLDILRFLPLLVVGRFAAFDDLSREDRVKMLGRMDASRFVPFTLIVVAFKTMLTIAFFEDEARQRAIGYPGPEREHYKRSLPVAAAPLPSAAARRDEVSV